MYLVFTRMPSGVTERTIQVCVVVSLVRRVLSLPFVDWLVVGWFMALSSGSF